MSVDPTIPAPAPRPTDAAAPDQPPGATPPGSPAPALTTTSASPTPAISAAPVPTGGSSPAAQAAPAGGRQLGAAAGETPPPDKATREVAGEKAASEAKPAEPLSETEILPPDNDDESLRGKIVLLLRALGKPRTEATPRTLVPRVSGPPAERPTLAPAAPPKRPGFVRRHLLFFICVLLPSALAAAYFLFYATDIYVSESCYVVRSPNKQSTSTGGFGALLEGAGFSGFAKAPDDVHAINQYIRSRDALAYLDERLDLHTAWRNDSIDLFNRFDPLGRDDSREALHEYYLERVQAVSDSASGITTLTVSGFTPEQVLEINKLLLGKAEELVNILNERGRNDLIRFAENEVKLAEEKAKKAAEALSEFRNTQAVVDPEKQTMMHFEQISRLQEELIRTRAQLTQLKVFSPDNPRPPALELRARTLENEIASETEKITGGEESLASKAAEYQRLQLDREFADKQLAVAMSSLEGARNEAQRQQLYLETIARPSLPDEAAYPKRLRGIATTFILGIVAWGILSMLLAGVREHQY